MASVKYPLCWAAWQRCAHRLLGPPAPEVAHSVAPERDHLYVDFILQRYTEPHRHYHTMHHLEAMLHQWSKYVAWRGDAAHHSAHPDQPLLQVSSSASLATSDSPPWLASLVLELSLLFHDAIYVPQRADNEEASARLARHFFQEHVLPTLAATRRRPGEATTSGASPHRHASPAGVQTIHDARDPWRLLQEIESRVCANIEQTKHHLSVAPVAVWQPTASEAIQRRDAVEEMPTDTQVLMDLDLTVLGDGSWEGYAAYASAIQKEYGFHSPAQFIAGRIAFLTAFLAKPQWFKTAYFYHRYEARARDNVRRELNQLKARHDDRSLQTSSKM